MQFDEYVKSLPLGEKKGSKKSAADSPKVIVAMLVGVEEKEARIDFLGSSYKVQRADIVDIVPAQGAVVTSRQEGYAVQITLKGSAILHAVSEYRASEFDQERPFVLNQQTQVPLNPLVSPYTPKEVAWLGARGLGHLAHGPVARQGELTITDCYNQTPTQCFSQCATTSLVDNSRVSDDQQNDDTPLDDQQADGPVPDDQSYDYGLTV